MNLVLKQNKGLRRWSLRIGSVEKDGVLWGIDL